jgi:glycosyltransferase involved in cell wall biosynthesis
MNGTTLAIHNLAHGLLSRGFEVYILTKDHYLTSPKISVDQNSLIRAKSSKRRIIEHFEYIFRSLVILKNLRKGDKVIIHAHGNLPALIASINKLIYKDPFVLTFHQLPLSPITKIIQKLNCHFATYIIAQSNPIKLKLTELIGTHISSKTLVLPNVIQISDTGTKIDIRKALSFRKILFLGDLSKNKGVALLLLAMHKVIDKVPDATLEIVGTGRQYENLLDLTRKLQLEKNVKFLGRLGREQVVEKYNSCSVVVLPSFSEYFPTVPLEASLMGRPVIATSTLGARSIIIPGKTGILVNIGDINGISNAIIEVLTNEQLALQLTEEARKHVCRLIDPDKITGSYVRIYKTLTRTKY